MGSHKRLNYIHIFRAIAIFIIVAGHCVSSSDPVLGPLLNVIWQDGTVLFVFIAGFLFQYLSDNFSYLTYLKKKFFNVVCPYLITSVVGIAAVFLYPPSNPFIGVNKIVQVGMFLTTGYVHNLPTWYIPMTCIFFLFAAVLLNLERKIVLKKYALLFFMLPVLIALSCFVPRGIFEFVNKEMSAWQAYFGYWGKTLFNTCLFFPVYILGMFFAKSREHIIILYQKRYLLWGLLLATSVLDFLFIVHHTSQVRLLLPKIVTTLLLLGYLEHYDDFFTEHPRLNAALGQVATYSFSIFFLHYYFIMGLHQFFEKFLHWNKAVLAADPTKWLIYTIVLFVIAFFGSLFASMLIKKMLEKLGIKHTRYFIGT